MLQYRIAKPLLKCHRIAYYSNMLQIQNSHMYLWLCYRITVADGEMGECVDPEGNGVTMGRGAEGGPGPPSGEQDKQLICNGGRGETSMGEPGEQQDGPDATSRTHHAQSM
jgi:hypothetical protein